MSSHPKYNREHFESATKMILDFIQATLKGQNKTIDLVHPSELQKMVDFKLNDEPMQHHKLMQLCRQILDRQTKPYHPNYYNTLFGGFDENSIIGAMMTPCINGSMYTYEMAPCFSLMEKEIYDHMRKKLQWEEIDAIMTPGGSFANIMGISLAIATRYPEYKQKGIKGLPNLKILTSDVSHYSFKKGAILCGLGMECIVPVKTNENGQMDVEDLQEKIKEEVEKGNEPFFVCATAGTTVEGAIDDAEKISEVTKKYKLWLHIDGAYSGIFLLSQKYRYKLGSCKSVDSMAWDAHKGALVPFQASLFMCRHPGQMMKANSTVAEYLFHQQRLSYDNSLDTGNKSFQCGRVIDILKFWTYLKGNGLKIVEDQINRKVELTAFLRKQILDRPDKYIMVVPQSQTFNICFWYIPEGLKKEEWEKQQYEKILSATTVLAKKFMIEQGKTLIGYSSTKGRPYFWRIAIGNPYTTEERLLEAIGLIEKYCGMGFKEVVAEFKKE